MLPQLKHTHTWAVLSLLLVLLSALLAGCVLPAGGEEAAPPSSEEMLTAAVRTGEAMRLERFGLTPSPPSQEALIATTAALTPGSDSGGFLTPAAVLPVGPTVAATQLAPLGAPTNAPANAASYRADFLADVTIPDGTSFAPGESFQKIWQISNTGSSAWSTAFELLYIDGNQLGAPASVTLPEEVAPGASVDIAVDMIAPEAAGSYTSYWKLRAPDGSIFGFGSSGNEAVWVKISVSSDGSGDGAAAEPTVDPALGEIIAAVGLSVDSANVSGACPHTFLFSAQVDLNKPATLTYALEAQAEGGVALRLPPPTTRNLAAGTHTLVFEVTLAENVSAVASLRLTTPGLMRSNPVTFTLVCSP